MYNILYIDFMNMHISRSNVSAMVMTVFAILFSFGIPVQGSAQGFNDLTNVHPYYKGMEALRTKDIIRGNPDSTVRPDAQVSRAELMTLILRATRAEPIVCRTQPF